jgi:hypothetical protein
MPPFLDDVERFNDTLGRFLVTSAVAESRLFGALKAEAREAASL